MLRGGAAITWCLAMATCWNISARAQSSVPTAPYWDHAWCDSVFAGKTATVAESPHLVVDANHDPVQRNTRGGKPLKLKSAEFTRGLYCHAVSKVRVRGLKAMAKLEAVIGVDSNEQTSGGRGSVIFAVLAGSKEVYRSPRVTESMDPIKLAADLGGVDEVTLIVEDAGDGIVWYMFVLG